MSHSTDPTIIGVEMLPQGLFVVFDDGSKVLYSIRTIHVALYLHLLTEGQGAGQVHLAAKVHPPTYFYD